MRKKRKNYRENAIGFGLAGLFLIGCSWELVWKETRVFFIGECVEGMVADTWTHKAREHTSSSTRRSKYVLLERSRITYTTKDGHTMHATAPISCRAGEKVRVYYDASAPSHMRVFTPSALAPLIFPLVGLGLLSISFISLMSAQRSSAEQ